MKDCFAILNLKCLVAGAIVSLMLLASCKKNIDNLMHGEDPIVQHGTSNTSAAIAKPGPISVCYVEVNSNSMLNVGKYTLASTGANVFDIGVIFAANINYDATAKKAVLYFNPQVTKVLNGKDTLIKPLQNQGIKVLLSILGNHQGAGIANFPTQAAAQDFAQKLADAVNTYGLDGIDFDDEYAEYGNNNTGQPNASSFVYLVTALRGLLPDKIISFYYIGPASQNLSYNNVTVGSKINYSWNPYYGSYSAPVVPGLTKSQLSPAAVDLSSTSSSTATSFANRTITDGYGVYLTYNLTATNQQTYISSFTNALYGSDAVYSATGGGGTTTGVTFYQNTNYGGTASQKLAKGTYTLSQLAAKGVPNDWASSVKVPAGWTVIMYSNDNFSGTSWTRTSDTPNFSTLSPSANDQVSSVKIQ